MTVRHNRFPLPALFLSCLLAFACGCSGRESATTAERKSEPITSELAKTETPNETSEKGTAALEFVLPDEPIERQNVAVNQTTTLEVIMRGLDQPEIEIIGSGVTAFVQSIGGITTNADHGWTFTINGEFAERGIGSTDVSPGQTIVWKFTTFEEAIK